MVDHHNNAAEAFYGQGPGRHFLCSRVVLEVATIVCHLLLVHNHVVENIHIMIGKDFHQRGR